MRRPLPSFLPAGAALTSWLLAGPASDRTPQVALWVYRWKAYWFDRNWRRQEILFPSARFEGEGGRNLIFVMGFWRSGTTLLHELLALGPRMAAPRTWQCMNPSGFRIGGPPAANTEVSRPMDAVAISARAPQEDEFALLARGAPSVYRVWIDPRRWEEVLPALVQETWLSLPEHEWFVDWRTFLGWCFPTGATTLVMKSPNHVFRLQALHRAWPNARLVWILRDPVDTWLSNRKMWSAMTAQYGLWTWATGNLDRFIFTAFQEYARTLRWATNTLSPGQLTFVAFDRMTRDPVQTMHAITTRLDLGAWEPWRAGLQPRLQGNAEYPRETYRNRESLPEYGDTIMDEICELHAGILQSRHAIGSWPPGAEVAGMGTPAVLQAR